MENIKYKEIKGKKVKTFQLGDEPEIFYLITIRMNEHMIIHENGYDVGTGKVEFLNTQELKDKYNVDLDEDIKEKPFSELLKKWLIESDCKEKDELELVQDFCTFLDNSHPESDISHALAAFDDEDYRVHNMASCMLSILDSLKLYDNDSLELGKETLSQVMFRKMKGYGIDLNKELGFTHLEPVKRNEVKTQEEILELMGWFTECESPFEIRHDDGSFASGQAAHITAYEVVQEYRDSQ